MGETKMLAMRLADQAALIAAKVLTAEEVRLATKWGIDLKDLLETKQRMAAAESGIQVPASSLTAEEVAAAVRFAREAKAPAQAK
jgi:hypothetical protein